MILSQELKVKDENQTLLTENEGIPLLQTQRNNTAIIFADKVT